LANIAVAMVEFLSSPHERSFGERIMVEGQRRIIRSR
jgi:hypothetical protein